MWPLAGLQVRYSYALISGQHCKQVGGMESGWDKVQRNVSPTMMSISSPNF